MVALAVLVACGGNEAADTDASRAGSSSTQAPVSTLAMITASPATTTTTAGDSEGGPGQSRELCQALSTDTEDSQDVDVFDPAALEEATRNSLAALEQLAGKVPAQVRDDFAVLLEANQEYVALLEENKWDLLAIPEDDPRVLGMSSEEVIAASEAIADFRGMNLGDSGSPDTTVSRSAGDLMPPQAGEVLATDPIIMVESAAPYQDLVDHYTSLLGRAPVDEREEGGLRAATFIAQYEGQQGALWVQETAEGIIVEISRN